MHRSARSLLAVAVIIACLVLWQRFRPTLPRSDSASQQIATSVKLPPASSEPIKPARDSQNIAVRLNVISKQLIASQDAKSNRQSLAELRRFLDSLDPTVASRELQTFLAGGKDTATKLDITIKPGGVLGDASSLRVFLLDYLGQIDRPAGGALAKQILSSYTTPDEWAVSLRNCAWADPSAEGRAFLRERTRELIHNDAWRQKPSTGYLEAFDVIVHTQDFDLVPDLAKLARDLDSRGVAYAAYLTLDRLTLTAPARALTPLVDRPELMSGREKTRANFVARADVRDPEQAVIVERYLLDASRTAEELETFSGIFPNANYMVSNNLLTPTVTPSRNDLVQRDRASLSKVGEWLNDPRFERLRPQLTTIHDRLRAFVSQASTP